MIERAALFSLLTTAILMAESIAISETIMSEPERVLSAPKSFAMAASNRPEARRMAKTEVAAKKWPSALFA